jgi:DNA-binding NarL/FixJ family response regulator
MAVPLGSRIPARDAARVCVSIVEENLLARGYLLSILGAHPDIRVLCAGVSPGYRSGASEAQVVQLIDVATLPTTLPKCLRKLQRRSLNARVLVLADSASLEEQCNLLALGVRGFLTYPAVREQLGSALKAVCEGRLWFERDTLEFYARSRATHETGSRHTKEGLTACEKRIVQLLRRNLSNKEIANLLGVSESDVKFHLASIFRKVGVRSRYLVAQMTAAA